MLHRTLHEMCVPIEKYSARIVAKGNFHRKNFWEIFPMDSGSNLLLNTYETPGNLFFEWLFLIKGWTLH